ncbi:putative carboxylesterase [Rosa chinensis]|uniref:Putative carboxylesterase n=1 Tax=Rosa chinensis TaxID=74649 RepID=A0A2P6PKH3_ROSCH|nr:putative carboxylesterase [Rosa chinensis]
MAIRESEHKFRDLKVVGILAIQPFFGGEERTESETRLKSVPLVNVERTDWMWKAFLQEGSDRDHPVVNVFGPNEVDISGVDFPETIVFVGGFDPLQDWQKRYYEGLKKRGTKRSWWCFQMPFILSMLIPSWMTLPCLLTESEISYKTQLV